MSQWWMDAIPGIIILSIIIVLVYIRFRRAAELTNRQLDNNERLIANSEVTNKIVTRNAELLERIAAALENIRDLLANRQNKRPLTVLWIR